MQLSDIVEHTQLRLSLLTEAGALDRTVSAIYTTDGTAGRADLTVRTG